MGDGYNRWPAVHRFDAARVYRLALERGTSGARYHAVADEGVPLKDIADVKGRRLGLPVVSKSLEAAADHFGWLATFAATDMVASSAQTQAQLRWRPTQPGLIADFERGHYFDAYAAPLHRWR